MAIREVKDKKTGKVIGYKARYYYIKDGKKRDADTKLCSTPNLAQKEAERLIKFHSDEAAQAEQKRRNTTIGTAWERFIESLEEEQKNKYSNSTLVYINTAKALLKNHMNYEFLHKQIGDMDCFTLRDYYLELNKDNNVGGKSIRLYKIVIVKFNRWLQLNKYYIEKDFDIQAEFAINRVQAKPSLANNREEAGKRNPISLHDFYDISHYWINKDLSIFKNFYFYTLFHVFFFSGMRVEEVVALQWCNVKLGRNDRKIIIENAIQQKETREHVKARMKNNRFLTKNTYSMRTIPILDFYYELLIDYKYKYKQYFKMDNVEDGFVFPNLFRNSIYEYGRNDTYRNALQKAATERGLPQTDLQMLRHSCAIFLILPPPEGQGLNRNDIYEYFGHRDTKMLEIVYAKLNQKQKEDRIAGVFKKTGMFHTEPTPEEEKEEKLKTTERNFFDYPEVFGTFFREDRIKAEIERTIAGKGKEYHYMEKDKEIIERYKTENPKSKLIFIKDKNEY